MAEIAKTKILAASVLKPLNDTRMTEKIALSLSDAPQFEVHVVGFPAKVELLPKMQLHSLPFFKRSSLKRLFIPWIILRKILALKPQLLIITTHELLWISLLARMITGCKIIYDVQENYYRNIRSTKVFLPVFRFFLAAYVRIKEVICAPWIDHFFLAERSYEGELGFVDSRYTILENKLKASPGEFTQRSNHRRAHLLFSGTLAETTGVFHAIDMAVNLHSLDKNITLILAGYCPQKETPEKIKNTIAPYAFIRLIGGDKLVAHQQILEQIRMADAGIIAYPFNPSTFNKVPTKLFEYLGYQLPILLIRHPQWEEICNRYAAAIVFDPETIHAAAILSSLKTKSFYTTRPGDVFWESEESKLAEAVCKCLSPAV